MGMFDYIRFSDETKEAFDIVGSGFQTKDFDCSMDNFFVDKEGFLWCENNPWWFGEKSQPTKVPFHGWLSFYDHPNNYLALFCGGKIFCVVDSDIDDVLPNKELLAEIFQWEGVEASLGWHLRTFAVRGLREFIPNEVRESFLGAAWSCLKKSNRVCDEEHNREETLTYLMKIS